MKMRRIPSIICAFSFFVVSSITAASDTSFDSVSYKDGRIERFLAARGTNCRSTAKVECIIRDTNGLPCEGNMRIKRSDCQDSNGDRITVPVPIKVKWQYCNTDTAVQTPFRDEVIAKYKNKIKSDLNLQDTPVGECVNFESNKQIDFCQQGAVMSIKYAGEITLRPDSYCFAFNFLRVRKEWIPEEEGSCAATTEIRCKIRGGDKNGERCAGNIINGSETCSMIDVTFEYQYCNWNPLPGTDLTFVRNRTWVKLGGEKQFNLTRTPLTPTEKCRIKSVDSQIDTCADSVTIAAIQVRGTLAGSTQVCESKSELRVFPTERCEYQFIMTEIVQDRAGGGSFIEVYSPQCANKIIADNVQLVIYRQATGNPSSDITNLKGLTIDQNGFVTVCYSTRANTIYGEDTCTLVSGILSPADSKPGDSIALIQWMSDGETVVVLDTFGSIIKDNPGPVIEGLINPRAVRVENSLTPRAEWVSNEWIFPADNTKIDPGRWFDIGHIDTPVAGRATVAPISAPSSLSTVEPTITATVAPTSAPPSLSTVEPTITPTSSPEAIGSPTTRPTVKQTNAPNSRLTIEPTQCNYNTLITEIIQDNNKIVYIEIMATHSCAYGKVIEEELWLKIKRRSSQLLADMNLNGKSFDQSGFLIICANDTGAYTCQANHDFGEIDNTALMVTLYERRSNAVIDVDTFGYNNGLCNASNRLNICFEPTGRAARKPAITDPKMAFFEPEEWIFITGLDSMTPGAPDDLPQDTSAPTYSPSRKGDVGGKGGKGGKGKGSRC